MGEKLGRLGAAEEELWGLLSTKASLVLGNVSLILASLASQIDKPRVSGLLGKPKLLVMGFYAAIQET